MSQGTTVDTVGFVHMADGTREDYEIITRLAREVEAGVAACADFCERWDQCAFDPDYDTLPLAHFEPMVGSVFEKPRQEFY